MSCHGKLLVAAHNQAFMKYIQDGIFYLPGNFLELLLSTSSKNFIATSSKIFEGPTSFFIAQCKSNFQPLGNKKRQSVLKTMILIQFCQNELACSSTNSITNRCAILFGCRRSCKIYQYLGHVHMQNAGAGNDRHSL